MSGPRWLSADEQRSWRAFIRTVHLVDAALDAQLQQDAGISHIQYSILAMLSEAPEQALRMTELADLTESSRSRLSHAVARLEGLGWVERRSCPTDKRGQLAALTGTGLAVLEAAAPGHVDRVRSAIFDVLSADEARTLGALLDRVARGLEPEAGADLGADAGLRADADAVADADADADLDTDLDTDTAVVRA